MCFTWMSYAKGWIFRRLSPEIKVQSMQFLLSGDLPEVLNLNGQGFESAVPAKKSERHSASSKITKIGNYGSQ